MRSFLGVSFVLLCIVGCNDGLSVSTNTDNVCSEIAKVSCHNVYQCCTEGEIESYLNVDQPRTEPQCQEDITRRCHRAIAQLDEAIAAKRVKFDSSTMNRCLDALIAPSDSCATVETEVPWEAACMESAWVGLVPDGSQCFNTFECASKDSICAPNQTCVAKARTGEPCGQFGCASGNFCSSTTGAPTCQPQLPEGSLCQSTTQCQTKLFCDLASPMPTCSSAKEGGATCTSNPGCKSGDCLPGTCAGSTTQCTSNFTCGRRCTNNGVTCNTDSTCGNGTCSTTTTTMCNNTGLTCPIGEFCVFPQRCQQVECSGRVCSLSQNVVDYCTEARVDPSDLPLL